MQVFISHADQDEKIARELSSHLSVAGVKPWLAQDEILLGENFPLEVGKALRRCDAMVVLLSPAAVASTNVRREVSYAFSSSRFEGRVIPVLIRPTKDVPSFLQTLPLIIARGSNANAIKETARKIVKSLQSAKEDRDGGNLFSEPRLAHG